ncbi:MAG: hypothetical protein ACI9XZ_000947 [Alphaproteobacteria bacterium]|jgi:hypothetical protein
MAVESVGAATYASVYVWPRIADRSQQEAILRRPHVPNIRARL